LKKITATTIGKLLQASRVFSLTIKRGVKETIGFLHVTRAIQQNLPKRSAKPSVFSRENRGAGDELFFFFFEFLFFFLNLVFDLYYDFLNVTICVIPSQVIGVAKDVVFQFNVFMPDV